MKLKANEIVTNRTRLRYLEASDHLLDVLESMGLNECQIYQDAIDQMDRETKDGLVIYTESFVKD
jgi:hypothetical protein